MHKKAFSQLVTVRVQIKGHVWIVLHDIWNEPQIL